MKANQQMNPTKNLFISLFFLVIYSCNLKEEKPHTEHDYILTKLDTISLNLDNYTIPKFSNIQCFENGSSVYLAVQNKNANTILLYDVTNSPFLAKRIQFEKEGNNGIGQLNSFLVHNLDSIFLYNFYQYRVFLSDSSGIINNKFNLISQEKNIGEYSSLPFSLQPIRPSAFIGDTLYIPAIPDYSPYKSNYSVNGLIIALNIKNGNYDYMYTKFPDIYKEGYFGQSHQVPFNCFDLSSNIVFSFPIDESIYIGSNGQFVSNHYASSDFFKKVKPMKNYTIDFNEISKQLYGQYYFSLILKDKFRNVYYRFLEYPMDIENNFDYSSIITGGSPKRETEVIILDINFKVIGNCKLPRNSYYLYDSFVHPKGLSIAYDNEPNEDKRSYHVFELKKK